MQAVHLQPNDQRTGFKTNSEFTKARLGEWMKQYSNFEIKPIVKDSKNGRRYLEGAIVVDYVAWQYGIDPREQGMGDVRRTLFKRDFHYSLVKDRDENPVRVPLSTLGKVNEVTQKYTEWAEQNGAPIPNPDLYKMWRDQYSMDVRWDCFHDWLDFLELESDAMPSAETFIKLKSTL